MILLRDMMDRRLPKHETISRCISGIVKIRTIFTVFILRCCILNIKGTCLHDALWYSLQFFHLSCT